MSDLTVYPVKTDADRRLFVRMTNDLYGEDQSFVQPLEVEILGRLNPKSSPLLKSAENQLWMVKRGDNIVGRIGAIINPSYIDHYNDQSGHFGFFEAIDDRDVIGLLFKTAQDWMEARGMASISGPYNFSVNEEIGLLIDGFERPPMIMMPHGKPYYKDHLEALGFEKAADMHALWYKTTSQFMSERRRKFIDKLIANKKVTVRNFNFKNYNHEIATAVEIFNDAWANNWGFVPITKEQAAHMASELRPLISPYNTVMCLLDDEPMAFGIVLPNINEIIGGFKGRLLPLNWVKLLWELKVKTPKTSRMPLMGIRQRYQGKPLGAAFAFKIIEMVNTANMAKGVTHAELSWILESNKPMVNMLLDIGGVIDKTYRIYKKPL